MSQRTLRDIARRDVVTARPDASGQTLARQMRDESVDSVVVVSDGYPLGIVTDRDLTVQLLAEGDDGSGVVARELMRDVSTSVRTDVTVHDALRKMDENDVRHLPVVDGGDRLNGLVTFEDICGELAAEHEHLRNVVDADPSR